MTSSHTNLEAELFVFLSRKYVQQSSARQREMNLKYMTAETHDLARELARFIESLSAPKSGESEAGPARSDSRHSRQGPQPTVDDSHGKERADEGKRPTPAGIETSALDESDQQSGREGLGDPRALHPLTDEDVAK